MKFILILITLIPSLALAFNKGDAVTIIEGEYKRCTAEVSVADNPQVDIVGLRNIRCEYEGGITITVLTTTFIAKKIVRLTNEYK